MHGLGPVAPEVSILRAAAHEQLGAVGVVVDDDAMSQGTVGVIEPRVEAVEHKRGRGRRPGPSEGTWAFCVMKRGRPG